MRRAAFLAVAIALASASAWATDPGPAPVAPRADPGERGGYVHTMLERLSEEDLKAFYLRCNREAVGGKLGSGQIAVCSQGYELLLRRSFQGDFFKLLEWRRGLVRAPLASPF